MRRAGERPIDRRHVTLQRIDDQIARHLVPNFRCVLGQCVTDRRDRRQHVVIDRNQLCRIFRLVQGVCDDDRDRLSDAADLVGHDRVDRGLEDRCAAAVLEFHIGRVAAMAQRLDSVGEIVGPGQDGQHARRFERRRPIDRPDAGMRVRRPQDVHYSLAGPVQIIAEFAGTRQQPIILDPGTVRADMVHFGRVATVAKV